MVLYRQKPASLAQNPASLVPVLGIFIGIVFGWATALLLMHYPMIFSGFARLQADLGDSRLNNYFLERSWVVLHQRHTSFWNPAFFYPQTNVTAYSDLMLSFAPFYWCWRSIGLLPDNAFAFWMMTGTTLNFFAASYWLRSCCKSGWLGAIIGAVFFAAAGPRATQLGHQQLQWQFFPMLALIAVYKIFLARNEFQAARWWAVLGLGVAAQFWGGFYSGWFLMLSLGLAAMLAIINGPWRRQLARIIQRDLLMMAGMATITALLLAPAVLHYLSVKNDLGGHPYEEVRYRLATTAAWIYPGPFSVERNLLKHLVALPAQKLERGISLGMLTSFMAVAGLWLGRKVRGFGLIAATGLLLIFLGTGVNGRYSLWWVAYNSVPGAEVIRAPVRIGLMLIVPATLGLAYFVDYIKNRRATLAMVLLVCLIEQATFLPSYDRQIARDRVAAVTAALPSNAKCFFYVGDNPADSEYIQIDAMWAGLIKGVPTLNGYSGSSPPGWDLSSSASQDQNGNQSLQRAVDRWSTRSRIDPTNIVWLRTDASNHVCMVTLPRAIANIDTQLLPVGDDGR